MAFVQSLVALAEAARATVIVRRLWRDFHDADHKEPDFLVSVWSASPNDHRRALGAFVAERGRLLHLDAGQVLFSEGERSDSVFACTGGRVNLFVTMPTGRELILGTRTAVEGFGELSAIAEAPRTATAQAMEPSTIRVMPGRGFLEGLESEGRLAIEVLRELAAQLTAANLRLSSRAVDSTTARVAQVLVELGGKLRRHADPDVQSLDVTQDEVAAWVGSTREASARSLAVLRKSGMIFTGRGSITVLDVDALERVALGDVSLP